VILALAAVVVVAAVAVTAVQGLVAPQVAFAFGGLIAFGELVRLRLPDDRVQSPIALAGSLGYALLSHLPGDMPALHSVFQTITVTAFGTLVGALPHVIAGRSSEVDGIAPRILVIGAVALAFRPVVLVPEIYQWLDSHRPAFVVITIAVAVITWPLQSAVAAGLSAGRRLGPFGALFRNELRAFLGIGSAIASTGVLIALATWEVGLWTLPLFSIPLLLAQTAYRRYAAIRRTQMQTILALSRSTEVGGYTETGHARRVADLALNIGRDLGLNEDRLNTLQYAALMHDLGQLSLADPIPGGATLLVTPDERRRIAALGAAVIRQTGVLEEVAAIVEAQAEPYRRPHLPDDADVPQEARIIKVANAYDDLVGASLADEARVDALERLRLGMAYEYDPRVVSSLARVLNRTASVPL
jgi:hypothetical protein